MYSQEQLLAALERRWGGGPSLTGSALSVLEVLLKSWAEEGELSPAGTRVCGEELVWVLHQRALLDNRSSEAGALNSKPKVIAIVGLPRTGSTLLHNLLACVEELRALSFFEAFAPGEDGSGVRPASAYLEQLYALNPEFRTIHYLESDMAEECITALQVTLRSERLGLLAFAPSYLEHLWSDSQIDAYREYARFLSAKEGSRRWVLKAPTHSLHIPELLGVFAEVQLVRVWRDPAEVLPSFVGLASSLARMTSRIEHGDSIWRFWGTGLERMARGAVEAPASLVVADVWYTELLKDPVAKALEVCRACGVETTADDRVRMISRLKQYPQDRWGRHVYPTPTMSSSTERAVDAIRGVLASVPGAPVRWAAAG